MSFYFSSFTKKQDQYDVGIEVRVIIADGFPKNDQATKSQVSAAREISKTYELFSLNGIHSTGFIVGRIGTKLMRKIWDLKKKISFMLILDKLILKSPRFVPYGVNLAKYVSPVPCTNCRRATLTRVLL